ncbi:MAG: ATP-binding cassette domain-containing protein [Oscillospiraceae bacterium]|jgi:putative ABC transport system ATP-binding protein|nr:ATP-binding cassette domain-containing protein [Oscillospiraceae bacterium]
MLKIENLCKIFNKNSIDEKIIFKDLNLKVEKGEFVTIIGGNGAGKSTLMNLISGSMFPDSGKIFVDNKSVTHLSEHKRAKFIGRVFQDPLKGTAPNLTIEENLLLAMLRDSKRNLVFGINKQNTDFFKNELEKLHLGLENRLKTKVGLLSGGQRQAITLLMATLIKPQILLLDEHTAALDPKSQDKILNLTEEITKNTEMATLMITHNIENAINFGNRMIMLKHGKIVLDLNGDERKTVDIYELQEKFNTIF